MCCAWILDAPLHSAEEEAVLARHFLRHNLLCMLPHSRCSCMSALCSEGVVHGDLKAANVMLATGGADPEGIWTITIGRRLVAKVADFGLAVSLGPSETHASLTARVGCGCESLAR
jgi:serine/threonine protein kinase